MTLFHILNTISFSTQNFRTFVKNMTNKCLQLLLLLKDDGSFQLIAFKQLRKHWNSYLNLSLSIVFSVQMKLQYYKLYQGNTSHSYIVCVDSAEIRDQCSGFIKIFLFHWSLIHAKRSIDTHCLLVYVFTTLHKFCKPQIGRKMTRFIQIRHAVLQHVSLWYKSPTKEESDSQISMHTWAALQPGSNHELLMYSSQPSCLRFQHNPAIMMLLRWKMQTFFVSLWAWITYSLTLGQINDRNDNWQNMKNN